MGWKGETRGRKTSLGMVAESYVKVNGQEVDQERKERERGPLNTSMVTH